MKRNASLHSHFPMRGESMTSDIQFLNLRSESSARRTQLVNEFYDQIYRAAFPKQDEAETPDTWLPLLDEVVPSGQPCIYIVLAGDDKARIVGGVIFEEYRMSGCWLLSYLAVSPAVRRQGIAKGLISEVLRIIDTEQSQVPILLAEAENPARICDAVDRAQAEARLRILDKLGMRQLPIGYVQPALGPGKSALDDLLLLCFDPVEGSSPIPASRIKKFLREFYAACGQANSYYISQISLTLSGHDFLSPKRLVS
jgi:GNAT superfamily N-acetyltransferase